MNRKHTRSRKGSLAGLLLAGVVLIVTMIGCLAADFCHMLAVKNELQNGCDAAALAGAYELWKDASKCEPIARQVAAMNYADGKALQENSDISLAVQVDEPTPPNVYGKVTVDGTIRIRNIIGHILGRHFDIVTAHAAAGSVGQLTEVYADQMFPLAVELSRGNNGVSLTTAHVNDVIQLDLNAQKYKNAGWTSLTRQPASASYIWEVIEQRLGIKEEEPGFTPSVSIGDDIYLLNGVMGGKKLEDAPYYPRLTDPSRQALILPIVTGDPAMNQKETVVGFMAFRVTNIITNGKKGKVETIVGRIERMQINGGSGPGSNTSQQLAQLLPGPVQLIE